MSRFTRKLRQWTAQVFELPEDMVSDVPRFTLIGNHQLYVENHRGIIHFAHDKLRLALAAGELEIIGRNLIIRGIWPEEVFIEGEIGEVKLHGMEEQTK